MKKYLFSLIAIPLIAFSLMGWDSGTQSASNLPYPEPVVGTGELSACKMTIANQIYLMRSAYNQNVSELLAQEIPTSEMVEPGFQALGTYRCWLDYLCEAVLYSANADPEVTKNSGGKLVSGLIEPIPGCTKPENIEIPVKFMPACGATEEEKVDEKKTVEFAYANYTSPQSLIQREFGDYMAVDRTKDIDTFPEGDKDHSPGYIALERALKANSAEQQVRPLRDKFQSILVKMQGMQSHMSFLKEQMQNLDTRLVCYCPQCDG